MNRRTLLTSAGASALLLPMPNLVSRRALAAKPPGTTAWGVRFDGSTTYLKNDGNIPSMPGLSDKCTVIFNYRPNPAKPGTVLTLGGDWTDTNCTRLNNTALIQITGPQMRIYLYGPRTQFCYGNDTVTGLVSNLPSDSQTWKNAVISWTGSTGTIKVTVNGQAYPVTIGHSGAGYNVATNFFRGTVVGGYWGGDLADLGVFAGTYIDPVLIVDNVYKEESGFAIKVAANGSGIIDGVIPQIWLSGPKATFPSNLAAGKWTWFPPSYTDSSPTGTFRVVGTLQNCPIPDPFEPGSGS